MIVLQPSYVRRQIETMGHCVPHQDPNICACSGLARIPLSGSLAPFPCWPGGEVQRVLKKVSHIYIVRGVEPLDVGQDLGSTHQKGVHRPPRRWRRRHLQIRRYRVQGLRKYSFNVGLPRGDSHDHTGTVKRVLFVAPTPSGLELSMDFDELINPMLQVRRRSLKLSTARGTLPFVLVHYRFHDGIREGKADLVGL